MTAPAGWRPGWLAAGRAATVLAVLLVLALQQINHDWFPPNVSVSQYGIGPNGWIFTSWSAVTVFAALAVWVANPFRERAIGYFLGIGGAGLVVMGIVRTDADGLQHSWHARVHMIASIVALVALPIGLAFGVRWARGWWFRVALTLLVISDLALIMVGVSALGVVTPGLDAQHSWALWQSVAASLDMALLSLCALATFAVPRERAAAADRFGRVRPGPAAKIIGSDPGAR